MPKIFISYRRDDSSAEAGRIYEKLIPVFGEANVIKDIDTFPVGGDFRTAITEGVIASDVMLVLIGKDWLTVKNASGQRRLDDPDDFVRYEVDLGLRRAKMQVIPVILGSARPPSENELPNRLRELAYRNAAFVRDDPDFSQDMERLIKFIHLHFPELPAPAPKQAAISSLNMPLLAGFVVLLALIVAGFIFLPSLLNNKGQGTQVADNPTEVANSTEASSPTNTDSPTNTPTDEPTATYTSTPTNTPPPTATSTPTITPSPGPTLTEFEAAVERAWNFAGTVNSAWIPYTTTFDGIEMALVPKGCFLMGSTESQSAYAQGLGAFEGFLYMEQPATTYCFGAPFWIDVTEVTQVQFREHGGSSDEAINWFDGDDLPVDMILWVEARDYCQSLGKRLPNEVEWEYAARGVEALIFPWGNEFDGTRANYCDTNCSSAWHDLAVNDGYEFTAPVASYANGQSWVGAYDLAGNIQEWTSTIFGIDTDSNYNYSDSGERLFPYPYNPDDGRESNLDTIANVRVVRGGSWAHGTPDLRGAVHFGSNTSMRFPNLGFRCVRDIEVP
jgi:formylglycine-generating enzyme required for sulfatase activity